MRPLLLLLLILLSGILYSQALPTIEEKTKGLERKDGFVPFYWDENTGKFWLEISRLDQDFLYQLSLPAGLGSNDIGLDRGLLGGTHVLRFKKTGRKILAVQPNFDYRALSNDPREKTAVEQSFAQSVLWGFTVEAQTGDRWLVDATDFLLRDAMLVATRLRRMQQGNFTFDKTRSAFFPERIRNFPLNTEVETTISFSSTDGSAGGYLRSVSPSDEAITVRMHHSFVQLPDPGYTPRAFDPRSGFIPISYFDYSTPVSEPIEKKFIIRHRLEKKDPNAARSEAVEPIVYYLDNGTPEPIRSALLDGAAWWNQAFEAAGFINAFQVKMLPDSADPMDIRYNMINWVHRSTRGWSYGASVVDPRTGEIIKGQVTLGSLRVRQDYLIATGLLAPYEQGVPADDKMMKMALARLRQLSAHEVGHTIGLMHNYSSSVNDRASVMDYPHPLVRLNEKGEIDMKNAYDDKIGEWDKLAIRWGYGQYPAGTNEGQAQQDMLTNAIANGSTFITDRDARAPGGLHPDAHLWDNGKSAVAELKEVMKVRKKALEQFGEKNIRQGTPLASLEDVLVPVYFFHRYQLEAATKLVGGMHYSYALRGDGQIPLRPLPRATQLEALLATLETIDPALLKIPDAIASLIPPRPSGYDMGRELFKKKTGLAFDLLSPAETAADFLFSFLYHPERINRLAEQEGIAGQLSLTETLRLILEKTWKATRRTGLEGLIQQQTEQVVLTYLLSLSISEELSFPAQAMVQQSLTELTSFIKTKMAGATGAYKAHLQLALERMKAPEKAKPTRHEAIPPGAPIGCDF